MSHTIPFGNTMENGFPNSQHHPDMVTSLPPCRNPFTMVISKAHPDRKTLYVCQECGDGIESSENMSRCPECGGLVQNSTVPHD